MGTLLPYFAQESLILPEGGQSSVPCPFPEGPEYVPEIVGYSITLTCSGGPGFITLSRSGGPEYIPGTVGCCLTWSFTGGSEFTSGGPWSITLSHSGLPEYVSGGPRFATMVPCSGLSSGCGTSVSRESCSEGSGFRVN